MLMYREFGVKLASADEMALVLHLVFEVYWN